VENLVTTGLSYPGEIALDIARRKLYWTDAGTGKIQRANLDGTGVEDLGIGGLRIPWAMALDVVGRKLYWTDAGTGKIQRANLDGTGVEDLVSTYASGPVKGGGQRYGLALSTGQ
jgi:sugar lactone lactonase YvrE